jgi:hypothetical protein
MRLWAALDETQGFQWPKYAPEQMVSFIHRAQMQLYRGYFRQRSQLPASQLAEIKFEDLLSRPEQVLQQTYEQLELSGWERIREPVRKYFADRQHVKPKSAADQRWSESIRQHWHDYATQFDYDLI